MVVVVWKGKAGGGNCEVKTNMNTIDVHNLPTSVNTCFRLQPRYKMQELTKYEIGHAFCKVMPLQTTQSWQMLAKQLRNMYETSPFLPSIAKSHIQNSSSWLLGHHSSFFLCCDWMLFCHSAEDRPLYRTISQARLTLLLWPHPLRGLPLLN